MPASSMLIGRLGNSMFQIAASIGYARKYGYDWAVQEHPHNGESAIHRVFPNLPKTHLKGPSYQEHPHGFCERHQNSYDQCHFNYHPIPDIGSDAFLRGFWQSYKYFEGASEEIKKIFELPLVPGYDDYVSIHVRRGDYVQHAGSFPPVTTDYIMKGISEIWRLKNIQRFMIFSDDIEWCKQTFLPNAWISDSDPDASIVVRHELEWHFSEGRNEHQDLSLMASCGHHIIANSTFSWWGAYLGHNPNRIVISPSAETWFGPTSGVKQPVHDLILPNWIQLHTR